MHLKLDEIYSIEKGSLLRVVDKRHSVTYAPGIRCYHLIVLDNSIDDTSSQAKWYVAASTGLKMAEGLRLIPWNTLVMAMNHVFNLDNDPRPGNNLFAKSSLWVPVLHEEVILAADARYLKLF